MNTRNSTLLSVELLRAVAANAADFDYPPHYLLREALIALRVEPDKLAFLLGVSRKELSSWLSPGEPRLMPPYAIRELHVVVQGVAHATECARRPDGDEPFPEETWVPRPREAFDQGPPPGSLGIDVDPAVYNEPFDDIPALGG